MDEEAIQTDALHIGDYITLKEILNDGYMSAEGMFHAFFNLISLHTAL